MDLTKRTQNEEMPIAVMTSFNVDSFVKDIMNTKAFGHQKLVKFFQLKENQENWWISTRFV